MEATDIGMLFDFVEEHWKSVVFVFGGVVAVVKARNRT